MTTPDHMAALVAACRNTLARIKNPDVRREYRLFLRERVAAYRDALNHDPRVSDALRAATEDERFWLEMNLPLWWDGRAAVMEIDGDRFAVVPMMEGA